MTPHVAEALAELRRAFPGFAIAHREDGQGGAYVIAEDLPLGPGFVPSTSWIGFAISGLYPRADVYPHFVRPDIARADGRALTTPLNPGHTMPGFGRPAVMVSRRSNRWDPARDTAALKLHRVLLWFTQQTQQREVAA
jgi:hypothetical protein